MRCAGTVGVRDGPAGDVAEAVRTGFAARGWKTQRLVWMLHDAARRTRPAELAVEEVPYDAVHPLREAWFREDFPDLRPGTYFEEAREVGRLLGSLVPTPASAFAPPEPRSRSCGCPNSRRPGPDKL